MNLLPEIMTFINISSMVLALCVTVGGFFAIKNVRQDKLTKFQKDTIDVSQQRITILEGIISDLKDKIEELGKENIVQQHIMDTIISALRQKGTIITVDGDMVTIQDKTGSSTHRKRIITTKQQATIIKKEEE